MKTAMQELIDELKEARSWGEEQYKTPYNLAIALASNLLEKEKESIKEAWWDGFKLKRVVVDSNADETYFNQKYNNNEGTTLG